MNILQQINDNKIKFEKVNEELYETIKRKATTLVDWKILFFILKREFKLCIKEAEELTNLQLKEYNKWIETKYNE